MNPLPAILVFGGAELLAILIAAWFESGLLKRRGWMEASRAWKFALAVNGLCAVLLGTLAYLTLTVAMLGALNGSRNAALSIIIQLLALGSPLLFFLLRLALTRSFRLETGRPIWRYAAASAILGWLFMLTAIIAAVMITSKYHRVADTRRSQSWNNHQKTYPIRAVGGVLGCCLDIHLAAVWTRRARRILQLFYDTRLPPQFFPANPLLTIALFLVLGHALVSPVVWVILGRVFCARAGSLALTAIFAYLLQGILIFISIYAGMWLTDADISFFGIWGLANWFLVLGLNLAAAVAAPLVMFITARATNK